MNGISTPFDSNLIATEINLTSVEIKIRRMTILIGDNLIGGLWCEFIFQFPCKCKELCQEYFHPSLDLTRSACDVTILLYCEL